MRNEGKRLRRTQTTVNAATNVVIGVNVPDAGQAYDPRMGLAFHRRIKQFRGVTLNAHVRLFAIALILLAVLLVFMVAVR